jgi:site-specific DNA-cytosine methylase
VEVYFSCEIDEKALRFQKIRFKDRITRLGSVELLTPDNLKKLGRIDLLIGGSPCNDLSLVNPRRRGLHGWF